jgi:[acyl-carrier-protein] S-malonyltransferase
MGRRLHDRHPAARAAFARAEEALEMPVRDLCFGGSEAELERTEVLQPLITACAWAAYSVWLEEYGPDSVVAAAGHSLGEFAALAAAGSLEWEETLRLVRERGRIMARAASSSPGRMLAVVGLDAGRIEEIRTQASERGRLWVANRNADVQFVLSGDIDAVFEAERLALGGGARRALVLSIPLPAHTPLMRDAGAEFARVVERLPMREPRCPVLGNGDGRPLHTPEELRAELVNHLLRPVDWAATMAAMQAVGVATVVELGPRRVLASLAAKHLQPVDTWNVDELFVDFAEAALA